jgi:hypothetical protein
MDHLADHEARQRNHQLANLRYHWEEAYDISWRDGVFRAVRRDDRSPVCAPTYRDISEMIRDDYLDRPVIPAARQASAPPSAWDSSARQDAPREDTARTDTVREGGLREGSPDG